MYLALCSYSISVARPAEKCKRKFSCLVPVVKKSRLWYNQDAVDSFDGKEVPTMSLALTFIVSVVAGVIANYISKWWDGDHRL